MEPNPESSALAIVLAYHERTKHRFQRYAAGPDTLDWDAQPAPFRRYEGCSKLSLPLLSELSVDDPAALAMARPFAATRGERSDWTLSTLAVLLQASLGITAWKTYGPDRWAVRANPSSGNLHPIEGYVIACGLPWLADGVYHYDPQEHVLEWRAVWTNSHTSTAALYIALTSLMWREAWKYGERAFRYCQLDAGHAIAAVASAAAVLGAEVAEDDAVSADELAALLGLDRTQDYPASRGRDSEREEPEILLRIALAEPDPDGVASATLPVPHSVEYFGKASVIDPRPMYLWSVIWDVAQATRSDGLSSMRARKHISSSEHRAPPRLISTRSAETVLLGRRSAQRFDPEHSLTADAFYAFLAAVMPNAPGTWHALPHAPSLDLIVFVHRVEGLQPGLYVLPRRGEQSAILVEQLARQYTLHPASLHDHHVPLQQLCVGEPEELKRVSRAVHCHQDIAATSLFALGMVADLEVQLSDHPSHYRALYREAGLIGQALYLQAEMQGLRGTGIGCYFDDAVHELFGLLNTHHQSLYHFTVGRGLEDARIETARAYPGRPNAP